MLLFCQSLFVGILNINNLLNGGTSLYYLCFLEQKEEIILLPGSEAILISSDDIDIS